MEQTIFFDFEPVIDNSVQATEKTLLLKWELVLGLPFPMNLPPVGILLITLFLLLIIFVGLVLRGIILAFLSEPEINLGPINSLLWIDQLNGLVQLGVILAIIIGINVQNPLKDTFGDNFCHWINIPGNLICCKSVKQNLWKIESLMEPYHGLVVNRKYLKSTGCGFESQQFGIQYGIYVISYIHYLAMYISNYIEETII